VSELRHADNGSTITNAHALESAKLTCCISR
jgi:hypothetical protein